MARTFIRQADQLASSDLYDDTIAPSQSTYETNVPSIEEDLNHLRSQISNLLNRDGSFPSGDWWADLNAPSTFTTDGVGKARGVQKLNTDLHALERKRVLTSFISLQDVRIPSNQNYVVLTNDQLPNPSGIGKVAAVGAETTGSVGKDIGVNFGSWYGPNGNTNGLVIGATAISPKNLCTIVTGSNRDPVLSGSQVVYGLLQFESDTDGHTMTGNTPTRAQLSFVTINSTGDALVSCSPEVLGGLDINYISPVRKALLQLNEQDFLRGAEVDVPSTSATSRQNAYDNQGTTAVSISADATADLGAGKYWVLRDATDANLFKITEDSGGSLSTVLVDSAVDYFDVNAGDVNFNSGIKVATGGTDINIGVNAGTIETTGNDSLTVKAAGTGDLTFTGREIFLYDSNEASSDWVQAGGIKLSDTATEWNIFSGTFGEVSLLKAAYNARRRDKVYSSVNVASVAADTDVVYPTNIDTELPQMLSGTFGKDYDVYLNGQLLNPGEGVNDYYRGSAVSGKALKFEFPLKQGDVICVVPYVRQD